MSAGGADWQLLGIAPTEENRAIRVAYAARLKAIDPESDPQAFIRLRNAYERVVAAAAPPVATPAPGTLPPLASVDAPADAAPAPEESAGQRHARAILDLLSNGDVGRPWLPPEAQEALISHWRALVTDPRMERLDYSDRVERWASALIADTSPLSAPILMLAAERFGWIDADRNVHSNRHLFEIAQRYRLLQLLHMASQPGSRHHSAWVELRRPSDGASRSRPVHPYIMFELIAAMRYALPQLSETFDPVRLATWELHAEAARTAHEQPDTRSPPSFAIGCLTMVILLLFAFGLNAFLTMVAGK